MADLCVGGRASVQDFVCSFLAGKQYAPPTDVRRVRYTKGTLCTVLYSSAYGTVKSKAPPLVMEREQRQLSAIRGTACLKHHGSCFASLTGLAWRASCRAWVLLLLSSCGLLARCCRALRLHRVMRIHANHALLLDCCQSTWAMGAGTCSTTITQRARPSMHAGHHLSQARIKQT
jgi:hypothetical protein